MGNKINKLKNIEDSKTVQTSLHVKPFLITKIEYPIYMYKYRFNINLKKTDVNYKFRLP